MIAPLKAPHESIVGLLFSPYPLSPPLHLLALYVPPPPPSPFSLPPSSLLLSQCAFLIWCMLPMENNGSIIIYHRLIKPFVKKHEKTIEGALDAGAKLAKEAGQQGILCVCVCVCQKGLMVT